MPNIVTNETDFPTKPEDINTTAHFWNAFDNNETEASALWVVRFAQKRGLGWVPFTLEEIEAFYREDSDGRLQDFRFNRLVDPQWVPPSLVRAFAGHSDPKIPVGGGWIVKNSESDHYYVTDEFIRRCHTSSPMAATISE